MGLHKPYNKNINALINSRLNYKHTNGCNCNKNIVLSVLMTRNFNQEFVQVRLRFKLKFLP